MAAARIMPFPLQRDAQPRAIQPNNVAAQVAVRAAVEQCAVQLVFRVVGAGAAQTAPAVDIGALRTAVRAGAIERNVAARIGACDDDVHLAARIHHGARGADRAQIAYLLEIEHQRGALETEALKRRDGGGTAERCDRAEKY